MTILNPIHVSIVFVKYVICKLFTCFEMKIRSDPKILFNLKQIITLEFSHLNLIPLCVKCLLFSVELIKCLIYVQYLIFFYCVQVQYQY